MKIWVHKKPTIYIGHKEEVTSVDITLGFLKLLVLVDEDLWVTKDQKSHLKPGWESDTESSQMM